MDNYELRITNYELRITNYEKEIDAILDTSIVWVGELS